MTESAKKRRKKEKREKKERSPAPAPPAPAPAAPAAPPPPAAAQEESESPPPAKKKRRPSVDITEMANSDDDLKSPSRSTRQGPPNQSRRLSWGKNKAKAFKKSMADLKTSSPILSPPPKGVLKTPKYTPSKSGGGKSGGGGKGKKRASATDYF
jgi:hypothetical protein